MISLGYLARGILQRQSSSSSFLNNNLFSHYGALEGIRCSIVMLLIFEDFSSTEWTLSERTLPS